MAEKDIKASNTKAVVKTPQKQDNTTPFDNFDIPVNMSPAEYIQEQIRLAQAQLKADIRKTKTNAIQLGATLVQKDFREGAEKKDKDGKPIIDNFGEVQRYPTKFYATFNFNGGSINQEVKQKDYNDLAINTEYFLNGYLGEVTNFGKTEIQPIFTSFEPISFDF